MNEGMSQEYEKAVLIEKEEIPYLRFPSDEVLLDPVQQEKRYEDLTSAMQLGNLYKRKVFIVFKDQEGIKKVRTTIWALTKKYVILKGGIVIPVCRVLKVEKF